MPPDTRVTPGVNPRAHSAKQGEMNFPAHVAPAERGGGLRSPHTSALGEISTPGSQTAPPTIPSVNTGGGVLGKGKKGMEVLVCAGTTPTEAVPTDRLDTNPLATGWGGVWELQLQLDRGRLPATGGGKA